MKLSRLIPLASVALVLVWTGAIRAETKVEVKNVHLCCGMCVAKVGAVLEKVDGITEPKCDQKGKVVTFTAKDNDTAKKAVQALADAGFHGDAGKDLAIKDDSGAEKGKVKTITLTGAHNCCGMCNAALQATLKKVDGVTDNTAKPKESTFEVSGDFDAQDLIKALNAAGFHVKVKK
jgi:mercuric ion binding protein